MTSVGRTDNRPTGPAQPKPADPVQSPPPAEKPQDSAKPAGATAAPQATDTFATAGKPAETSSRLEMAPPRPRADRSRLRSKAFGATASTKAETTSAPGAGASLDARLAAAEAPLKAADTTGPAPTGPGKVPDNPQDLKKIYKELSGKSQEDLQKIQKDLVAVRDGDPGQKLLAMTRLAATFPESLKGALNAVGIKGGVVDKILDKPSILKSAATLLDGSKSATDRIGAALGLAKDVTGIIPKDQLPKIVSDLKPALPVAKELASLVGTFQDDKKSALDKAGAVVSFLKAAKDAVPADKFPELADKLKAFGAPLEVVSNALVLADPNKSISDKAAAAAKIWANSGEALDSGKKMVDWLKGAGVPAAEAGKVAEQVATTAGTKLAEDLAKAIPPGVASKLSAEEVEKLNKLVGTEGLKDGLGKVLKNVGDPEQVRSLIKGLEGAAPATQKAMLEGLGGMEKKALQKLMTETVEGKPALEVMQKVLAKVPEGMVGDAAKLFGKIDSDAAKVLLKLGEKADGKVVGELLGQAGKVADKIDSKVLSEGLKSLDKLTEALARNGVKLTEEAAGKVLKGLGKMIPALGAIPAFMSAYDMGKIAVETNSPQIRYLAGMGAALNTVDGALGVAEAFGVGNVDLPVQLAMGVAEIGLDLYVSHLREQEKAGTFKPTPELNAAIGATALATMPMGMQMMIGSFGIPGSIDVLKDTAAVGGKLAITAGKELAKLQGAGVEQQLNMTADAINTMADVIRNPDKYGKAAQAMGRQAMEGLRNMADQAGEVGQKALKAMGDVVEDLKKKGEAGLDTLKWIANNPGKAAEQAQKALGDIAQKGLTALNDAEKAVGKKALEALNEAAKTYKSAKTQVEKTVGEIAKKGEAAIDTLKWAAQNPGVVADAAKKELVDLALKGGAAAKKAYDTLVDLGDKGKAAVEDLAKKAAAAGEKGLETLKWIAENPGKASDIAVQEAVNGLKSLAQGTADAAKAARAALVKLADDTGKAGQRAVDALVDVVKQGGAAADEVLNAWKGNLTRGGTKVIEALGNLGDAGMEALGRVAQKGGQLASQALDTVLSTAGSGYDKIASFLKSAPDMAGALFKKAYDDGGVEMLGKLAIGLSPMGMGVMMAKWVWDNRDTLKMGAMDMLSFARKVGGDFLSFLKDKLSPF
jgi:hypothetical protein